MIKKSSLTAILRMCGVMDSSVCPYIAVQLPAGKPPVFYRSSAFSFVQSSKFDPQGLRYFVSYSHLLDCLKASADNVELSTNAAGIVCIESVDGPYRNFLHVHTVREENTGRKYHKIGDAFKIKLDSTILEKLDVSSFELASQPSIVNGKLMLGTQAGLVKWAAPESIKKLPIFPRKSFLDFACGSKLDNLSISDEGYWVVQKDGIAGCFSSHDMNSMTYKIFEVVGTPVVELDGNRLVQALRSALMLCEKSDRIGITPQKGVVCRDKYGNVALFSLGVVTPNDWADFAITGSTALLLVGALSQSDAEKVVLQNITPQSGSVAMRLTRGDFEVDFRLML